MIVQVGSYPPPIGGVSVYVSRMKDRLDAEGIPNEVWDTARGHKGVANVIPSRFRFVPLRHLLRPGIRVVHYHVTGIRSKLIIGIFNRFLLKRRKKVLTIHGECEDLFPEDKSKAMVKALSSFDAVVCCKAGNAEYLRRRGVLTDIREIPAFAPPVVKEEDARAIPEAVWRFVAERDPVIAANAYKIVFHKGQDLYGIDMCVALCARLKKTYKSIGLICCLPQIGNQDYLDAMDARIEEEGIAENFLFVTQPYPFYPLLRKSSILVRPTNTDGDAVSVRESLFFGTPVLASDVVPRPEGTNVFTTRDHDDFFDKASDMLANLDEYRTRIANLAVEDNFGRILAIYRELGLPGPPTRPDNPSSSEGPAL